MNPYLLILFRAFNMTFGRVPLFSYLSRRLLVFLFITSKKDKYVASSRYFSVREL